ncbi:MAG: 3-deoxy-7-phosphoheptulonate synthase [Myxococcales bacterium]|nr:3-deoxy-7-phosphoheptulonate synthase [Myxococcales bacterium]
MIVVMEPGAPEKQIDTVVRRIEELGYRTHVLRGVEKTVIAALGDEREKMRLQALRSLEYVEDVVPILKPHKLASRTWKKESSLVPVGPDVAIGGPEFVVIAGPCSVESEPQIMETATVVKSMGARILRGGAFKPRTSPYAFQGLEEEGLRLLAKAREQTGLPIVTELLNPYHLEQVAEYADMIQIGARNVQNFALLKEVGRAKLPVLLKRGMSTTIDEFLMSAEYVLSEGNANVVLCERGIRTFETATRNTLDLAAVCVLKRHTHLPVIVDPSHGTGNWQYVTPMALAATGAGADGLMIEVHPDPTVAWSDGPQSLRPDKFRELMQKLRPFVAAAERTLAPMEG